MVKVRFAPSPTGIQHIGGTRTALFDYLFAKKNKGEFILRIEDTDQKRIVKGSKEALLEILEWLGIKYDGEITYQSQRLDIYSEYAQKLIERKIAYEKDGAIWVNVPDDKTFQWTDLVGNKNISFKGADVEDFVILKSDGFPTYHLANVIDDHLMDITHVLRGEEWTSSTPKHLYLYESLGWEPPKFAHLPVILGPDKTKLSKRHGAKSALDYKAEGFVKEALLNYMALLGWNPGGDKEQMSLSEMEELFKLEDINTANPIFDQTKLEWLNGVWIRNIGIIELKNRLLEFYKEDEEVTKILISENADKLLISSSTRMKTLVDFKTLILPNKEIKLSENQINLAEELKGKYEKLENWEKPFISNATISTRDATGSSTKDVYTVLTGRPFGLPFEETLEIQGQSGTVSLLDELLKKNKK